MNEKLKVSRKSSRKVNGMHIIATLIGWVSLITGFILILCSIEDISYYQPDFTLFFIGITLIASSFTCLIVARFFKALYPIVRVSEVQDAKNNEKYEIIVIEDE